MSLQTTCSLIHDFRKVQEATRDFCRKRSTHEKRGRFVCTNEVQQSAIGMEEAKNKYRLLFSVLLLPL